MRRARTIICLLVLALTVPAAYIMHQALPPDAQPMIERKYSGWSGLSGGRCFSVCSGFAPAAAPILPQLLPARAP